MESVFEDCRASQNRRELKWLLTSVQEKRRNVVLEIGTWRGYSMEVWYKALSPEFLLTLENDPEVLEFLDGRFARGELKYMDPQPIVVRGSSFDPSVVHQVDNLLGGRKIDFLFIDGSHRYDSVKADFEAYLPYMAQGSIVGFHDVALEGEKWIDAGVEVKRYFAELKEKYKWGEFHDEEGSGTGTGIVYL
jgi:predicted O-methyltransferase YrrM